MENRVKKILFLCLLLFGVSATAATLTTDNYRITVNVNCSEGHVSCRDVTYEGVSKKSGNSIKLQGKTWHTLCADGVTPCRFRGYLFKNGSYRYLVHQSGLLQVIQGKNNVLVEENGEWVY